jgi:hypothetical protein
MLNSYHNFVRSAVRPTFAVGFIGAPRGGGREASVR